MWLHIHGIPNKLQVFEVTQGPCEAPHSSNTEPEKSPQTMFRCGMICEPIIEQGASQIFMTKACTSFCPHIGIPGQGKDVRVATSYIKYKQLLESQVRKYKY